MNDIEAAERAVWVGHNIAYNLEFIPSDKLDWKPAPGARSALEIIDHVASVVHGLTSRLSGGEGQIDFATPETGDQARTLILAKTKELAQVLRGLPPQKWNELVAGTDEPITWGKLVEYVNFDLCHHHGQICYLQILLGDPEVHFQMQPPES